MASCSPKPSTPSPHLSPYTHVQLRPTCPACACCSHQFSLSSQPPCTRVLSIAPTSQQTRTLTVQEPGQQELFSFKPNASTGPTPVLSAERQAEQWGPSRPGVMGLPSCPLSRDPSVSVPPDTLGFSGQALSKLSLPPTLSSEGGAVGLTSVPHT